MVEMLRHVANLVPAAGLESPCEIGVAAGDAGHRLHRVLQRTGNAAGNQGQQHATEQDDDQADARSLEGLLHELLANVVNVDAGTQNPAPGLEQLNIRNLRHRRVMPGLWPAVIDGAGAVLLDHADHDIEQFGAVRVLVVLQGFAIQFRVGRMHDHARMQVVDPEIVVRPITQLTQQLLRFRLGLRPVHHPFDFQPVVLLENADGAFHQVLGLFRLSAMEIIVELLELEYALEDQHQQEKSENKPKSVTNRQGTQRHVY